MKKTLYALALLAALVGLAVALNRSPDAHRSKIKAAVGEQDPVAGLLGLGALKAFVSHYQSLVVASYTEVNDHTDSDEAFGIVLLVD